MDLGLKGKTAIVCAASKGLGRGCAGMKQDRVGIGDTIDLTDQILTCKPLQQARRGVIGADRIG